MTQDSVLDLRNMGGGRLACVPLTPLFQAWPPPLLLRLSGMAKPTASLPVEEMPTEEGWENGSERPMTSDSFRPQSLRHAMDVLKLAKYFRGM